MSEYDLDSEIINVPGMTAGAEHDEFLVNNDKAERNNPEFVLQN